LSHAELSESTITRIDVGTTFPVERNIHEYLNTITSYPRLEKITYDDSVEFRGAFKKVIFYNKVLKEFKYNKGNPLSYRGISVKEETLLRFEIQYRRVSALQDQLFGIRTMNQILDQSHILWDLILTEFTKVDFNSTGILKADFEIKDTAQVLTALILFAFKGTKEPSDLANEWYDRGWIKYNHKYSILKKLEEMEGNLIIENNIKDQLYREIVYEILNSSLPYIIHRYFTFEKFHPIMDIDLNGETEV
jgi:hypothetical protein